MGGQQTAEDPSPRRAATHAKLPGVVLVSSAGAPCFEVVPLRAGALELGREQLDAMHIEDERVSRQHLGLGVSGSAASVWTVRDLGSRNGTRVDGVAIEGAWAGPAPRVIRIGQTLIVPKADVTLHVTHGLSASAEAVVGPQLRALHEQITAIARSGQNLLISGPSGAGKELAAQVFHRARAGAGERPFVALNCATIPEGLAERLLFGARRGAYSGAVSDAAGLVQAADHGTLFLDEIGDLPLEVQAKLLRVIETKQVLPIGALEPIPVAFSICAATLKDLRAEVVAGRFREDLYFRVARPELTLPALAQRPEEIPWLIQRALEQAEGAGPRVADVEFVEACLLRAWPGNVRELLSEVRSAAALAGEAAQVVGLEQLPASAGVSLRSQPPTRAGEPPMDSIERALWAASGNVSQAALELGITRSKVRRFVDKAGLDLAAMRRK